VTADVAGLPVVDVGGLETEAPRGTKSWPVRRAIDLLGLVFLALVLVGELIVVLLNIGIREVYGNSLTWQTEVTQFSLAAFAFVGGAISYARGYQVAITAVRERLPENVRLRVEEGVDLLVLVTSVGMFIAGIPTLRAYLPLKTPVLEFSEGILFVPFLIGMALFAFYAACNLFDRWKGRETLIACVAYLVAFGVLAFVNWYFLAPLLSSGAMPVAIVLSFVILVVLGVPIGYVLMGSAALIIWTTDVTTVSIVPQTMGNATNKFLFVAVPFFVFAGLMMANSGVSDRIAKFIQSLVGAAPGGFFHVIIVSMYLFSGLSGSKLADTVAVGAPMGDMLDKHGYSRSEGAAVLTASAVMGETVPPSLALLILGSVTSLSVGTLFIAGLVPAAFLALCMMGFVYFKCRKTGEGTGPARGSWASVGGDFLRAVPGLILPAILIGGIAFGVATPTEISSFAAVYGLGLAAVYRTGIKEFWQIVVGAVQTAGMVLFLLTSAAAFSYVLAYAQIPQDVATFVGDHLDHAWMFMLVSIVMLIIFGCALEGAAALIIMAPVLLPVAIELGINPIQYGLVLIIAMGIGTHLPPVGMGVYVAAATMDVPIEKVVRPLLGYLGVIFVGLLLIAFVEPITTVLPDLLGVGQ
jgi:tripartite ATP-independent transporter DctM subunit